MLWFAESGNEFSGIVVLIFCLIFQKAFIDEDGIFAPLSSVTEKNPKEDIQSRDVSTLNTIDRLNLTGLITLL